LASKLKRFKINVPNNIEKFGNSVSATLPILIDEDTKDNPIVRGENILLAGFGVGLSWGAFSVKLNIADIFPIEEDDSIFEEGIIQSAKEL
jgi:3-oxoacyl-[acyl-carrier-protein] synthase-3